MSLEVKENIKGNFLGLAILNTIVWSFILSISNNSTFMENMFPKGVTIGLGITFITIFSNVLLKKMLWAQTEEKYIGELDINSGDLLICDPFFLKKLPEGSMELKGLNKGKFPAKLTLRKKGKNKQIIKAEFGIMDVKGEKKLLGKLPVVTNSICIVDKKTFQNNFISQGPERIGTIYAKNHTEIAEKIKEKLELDYVQESAMTSKFIEPISENLERGIRTFLNQKEKEAFFIWTNNTYDKLAKKLAKSYQPYYSQINYDFGKDGCENIIIFSATDKGFQSVYGVFYKQKLAKITIE